MKELMQAIEPAELAELHAHFGLAAQKQVYLIVDSPFLTGEHQRLTSDGRRGEICYIMHRGDPAGGVLLHRKTIYLPNAYRLPTGGIHQGERVLDTLAREIEEETGLHVGNGPEHVRVERYLGVLAYDLEHRTLGNVHQFATYHFLVSAPANATLNPLDPDEKIAGWYWQPIIEMDRQADLLEKLTVNSGEWADWGRFRALSHRFVAKALQEPPANG